ncbi:hypothetical protein [Rubinisphaera brasiliensis]|uniref:Uncharacterized protein n=1 Tax=Rubinisphaera brasiliensis (strain ATCC 49424 / DSM 5305 / JCM 21570 / IAM 15109 / NBRC 103401 / IFAM 1448) TaxID=756272 RepID=F0SKU6_RUBBR|nr:hypothetical protein [Rubinisphaera brasiliensis]ADY58766.1 hypothetical protein Plabr_1150 [Rubinisphaera brasiliensis DSM 5305]
MATATHLGDMTIEEAATESAGNWRTFECFVWWRESELERSDHWMIHYTHHRDSGLLDQSNAEQISEALAPFTVGDDPDVVEESHNHWAVGHIDGFSIRVFRDGEITEVFRTFHGLMESLAAYPILDEEDFSNREYEATVENIVDAAWRLRDEYELPENWQYEVYGWLSDHECSEIECTGDQGGYPSEDSLRRAMNALFEQDE